jgi:hypothetical protein
MSGVNTSSELVRDAINLCNATIQSLSATQGKMQNSYCSAGNEWSDAKYRQLGDIVNDCSREIRRTLEALGGCLVPLNRLEQSIAEYESVSLAGMRGYDSFVNADINSRLAEYNAVSGGSEVNKQQIKEETGWSDEIVNAIITMEEYGIYKRAGLVEAEISGKKCLIRNDIDWGKTDKDGLSNLERVNRRPPPPSIKPLAPIGSDGRPIQLHHIGQMEDSPLAELTFSEHRQHGNHTILHDNSSATRVHYEGNDWTSQRNGYWGARAAEMRRTNDEHY